MMIVGRNLMMVERDIRRGGESESTLWKTEEERGEEAWAALPAELKVRTAALHEEEMEEEGEEEEEEMEEGAASAAAAAVAALQ